MMKKEASQSNSLAVQDPFYSPTPYILRGKCVLQKLDPRSGICCIRHLK